MYIKVEGTRQEQVSLLHGGGRDCTGCIAKVVPNKQSKSN